MIHCIHYGPTICMQPGASFPELCMSSFVFMHERLKASWRSPLSNKERIRQLPIFSQ